MSNISVFAVAAVASAIAPTALAAEPAAAPAAVEIVAARDGAWTAEWRAPSPTSRLVFARSTDDQRVRDWTAVDPAFEIVRAGEDGEAVRRKDGRPFRTVRLRMSARYAELPKDYAPFSPFGDGGLLFHSGRFFACTGPCPDGARWPMRLDAGGRRVLLDGREHRGVARWTDRDSGRNVYLGDASPVETPELLAVIDRALPAAIREPLKAQLPRFMRRFEGELGALPDRPMLFASYDLAHAPGWGRQGGALPGQVFVHFYGAVWPEKAAAADFAEDLAWLFAHEAAHLYQGAGTGDTIDAWIHEGAAEALAAVALGDEGGQPARFARAETERAVTLCERDREGESMHAAVKAGRFDAAYTCGLLVNLALDRVLSKGAAPGTGLYALWRDYLARIEGGAPAGEATYLAAVAAAGGEPLAEAARRAVHDATPDFAAIR